MTSHHDLWNYSISVAHIGLIDEGLDMLSEPNLFSQLSVKWK